MTGFRALAVQNRYLAVRCQVHSLRAPAELNERNLAGAWRLPRMTRDTAGEWSDRSGMRGAHDAISSVLSKYRSKKDDTKIDIRRSSSFLGGRLRGVDIFDLWYLPAGVLLDGPLQQIVASSAEPAALLQFRLDRLLRCGFLRFPFHCDLLLLRLHHPVMRHFCVREIHGSISMMR